MDRIVIGDLDSPLYELSGKDLTRVSTRLNSTLSGDKLVVDQCLPIMHFGGYVNLYRYITRDQQQYITADGARYLVRPARVMPDQLPYGTPLRYYQNDTLVGKFYIESVKRTSVYHFAITAVSAIGILDKQQHYGNVYRLVRFEDVAREIIGNDFSFSCDADVADIRISNWLPYDTKRNNLHQLLFATGVVVHKNSDGDMHFTFPGTTPSKTFTTANVFENGTVTQQAPASSVELTEHAYQMFAATNEEVLFDNVESSQTADKTFVSFKNAPVHSLRAEGALTIVQSGVNYAIVSGVGTLYGKPYTHTTRVLSANTGISTLESKAVSVSDVYLVNVMNSINVLNRLVAYYKTVQTVKHSIVYNGEKPGDQFIVPGPFGSSVSAYMSKMDITASSFLRASCEFVVDYTPTEGGNTYKHCIEVTESGDVTLPENVGSSVFVVMVGGGSAGASGGKGGNGQNGNQGAAGAGGVAGPGGSGGKVLALNVPASPGQVVRVVIGVGGEGVVGTTIEPIAGAAGTATSYGSYTSENGAPTEYGYSDIFTGNVYGLPGAAGPYPGGRGVGTGADAENVVVNGITYTPGANGKSDYMEDTNPDGHDWYIRAYGGGGGGPAASANGHPGSDGSVDYNNGWGFGDGGNGGNGADATVPGVDATSRGSGGGGGNGGGGGGAGGLGQESGSNGLWPGNGGTGGNGSRGGRGADGICLIYY